MRQLSPQEWEITNAVEQLYYLDAGIPSLSRVADLCGVPLGTIEKSLRDPVVVESLNLRGINIGASEELLSSEQLLALSLLFDTKDGRSLKKKFADAGITTTQFEAWKQQPAFANYLRTRAESALQKNIAETEISLMDSASRGDIAAIKLHLEMAGRWSSKTVGELNVEFLLMKILEAVQKHVKDPEAIEAIAGELLALAPSGNTNAQPGAAAIPQSILPLM